MTSIGAVFVTGASDGFRHWTFIFRPVARAWISVALLTSSLRKGFGGLDGLDTAPIIGYALVRPRMTVSAGTVKAMRFPLSSAR